MGENLKLIARGLTKVLTKKIELLKVSIFFLNYVFKIILIVSYSHLLNKIRW